MHSMNHVHIWQWCEHCCKTCYLIDETPALLSHCINQAVMNQDKIYTMDSRHQLNWQTAVDLAMLLA
jgi:hypothetical protein